MKFKRQNGIEYLDRLRSIHLFEKRNKWKSYSTFSVAFKYKWYIVVEGSRSCVGIVNILPASRVGDPPDVLILPHRRRNSQLHKRVAGTNARMTIVQDRPTRQFKHNKLHEIYLFEKLFKCFCSGQNAGNVELRISRLIVGSSLVL